MTVVYIYRQPKFEILQYSLKGVERHVEYDSICVVGDVPDWWEYDAIPTEPKECIFEDVFHKYQLIVKEIEDDILLMPDDIFITKPYTPIQYYNGLLKDRPMQGKRKEVFQNTLSVYPDIRNFNTHRPIPVKREVFKKTLEMFDKPFSHDAFCFGFPQVQAEDCKGKYNEPIFSTYNEGEWLIPKIIQLTNP